MKNWGWGLWSRATCTLCPIGYTHRLWNYTCIHFCPLTDLLYMIVGLLLPGAVHFNHSNCILEQQLLWFITQIILGMLCFYYYYPHLLFYFLSVWCWLILFNYAEAVFLLGGLEGLDYTDKLNQSLIRCRIHNSALVLWLHVCIRGGWNVSHMIFHGCRQVYYTWQESQTALQNFWSPGEINVCNVNSNPLLGQ